MNKPMISSISILLLIVLAGTILSACGSSSTPAPTSTSPSAGGGSSLDGQAIMQRTCSMCHSITRVTSAHHTVAQWQNTVTRMIGHGAKLTSKEEQVLIDYLAQNYK